VVWVREAGLPYPLVNVALHGTKGQLLGLPDLFDVESALVGEYDGAGHRIDTQHQADNIREERFESHNLTVVRATKGDLLGSRRPLVERLRDGRRRGLERVRARDKWRVHLG
jgi:hypothetical protein